MPSILCQRFFAGGRKLRFQIFLENHETCSKHNSYLASMKPARPARTPLNGRPDAMSYQSGVSILLAELSESAGWLDVPIN
jgi:hypothetical protein